MAGFGVFAVDVVNQISSRNVNKMELNSEKIKIKDILELKQNNMLSVNPEYQRGAVWKEPQQKKLIDSVLRGYPLPLIY